MGPRKLLLFTYVALLFVPVVVSNLLQKLVYVEKLKGDDYDGFIGSIQHLAVVYFFKPDNPIRSNFLKEVEKSAAIMTIYDTKFGIVDCSAYPDVGHCNEKNSEEQVYMYRNSHMILHVSVHSMFNVDSIISNVLQVVLLHEAPILQTVSEKDNFIAENRGFFDVIFSYQRALGTYGHRILMEAVFVYQHSYNFAISNEQKTVENLPYYSPTDLSAVWLFHCKSVRPQDRDCPVYKFRGTMGRSTLAKFFRAVELPTLVHNVEKDGNFDPYRESEIDVLFVFYDSRKSENEARTLIEEFRTNYFGLMGIITVNVDEVDVTGYKFQSGRKLPLLAFRNAGTMDLVYMERHDTTTGFLERMLNFPRTSADGKQANNYEGEDVQDGASDLDSEMENQDDAVAKLAFELRNVPFDRTHLPALNDKSFYSEVSDRLFLMVLFYLDFDARNQIVVRLFANAAEVLAKDGQFPLAAVECFDWTDVCGKVNISVYPTVLIYKSNAEPVLYSGSLSVKSFVTAAKFHMLDAPVALSTVEEASSFADGSFPAGIKDHSSVAVVGAFGTEHLKYESVFKMAARQLHGRYLCGIARDDVAESICKSHGFEVPCIITFKRQDQLEPLRMVKLDDLVENLVNNIELSIFHLLPELTAETFPAYYRMKKPFVILFTSDSESARFRAISSLAADGQMSQDVLLAWMNISDKLSVGGQVLHHHVKEPHEEEILVINHKTGEVHRYSEQEISGDAISAWLGSVVNGNVKTTMRLSDAEWKPRLPGFDFLKKMDDDAAKRNSHGSQMSSYMKEVNEHGLGTDDDELIYNMIDNELGDNMEHEIQMELEQLKYSRLYQKSHKKSGQKPASVSEGRTESEVKMKKKMTLIHGEL